MNSCFRSAGRHALAKLEHRPNEGRLYDCFCRLLPPQRAGLPPPLPSPEPLHDPSLPRCVRGQASPDCGELRVPVVQSCSYHILMEYSFECHQ